MFEELKIRYNIPGSSSAISGMLVTSRSHSFVSDFNGRATRRQRACAAMIKAAFDNTPSMTCLCALAALTVCRSSSNAACLIDVELCATLNGCSKSPCSVVSSTYVTDCKCLLRSLMLTHSFANAVLYLVDKRHRIASPVTSGPSTYIASAASLGSMTLSTIC
jgi:hypothetical protein